MGAKRAGGARRPLPITDEREEGSRITNLTSRETVQKALDLSVSMDCINRHLFALFYMNFPDRLDSNSFLREARAYLLAHCGHDVPIKTINHRFTIGKWNAAKNKSEIAGDPITELQAIQNLSLRERIAYMLIISYKKRLAVARKIIKGGLTDERREQDEMWERAWKGDRDAARWYDERRMKYWNACRKWITERWCNAPKRRNPEIIGCSPIPFNWFWKD
jgi:hypothetical protein